jgi:signal transduction histidine kinase
MTVARVCAEVLAKQTHDPAVVLKMSDRIVGGIDRADHMIRDLLDANRIQAGEKLPLKLTEFDLAALVKRTLGELTTVHGKRFEFRSQGPVVGAWSKQDLRRVIENLVNNAVKYGDPDKPVVVAVKREPKRGAVFSVQNFGNPIPKEEQPTLFRQFRRAPGAAKGAQKGWGIGLTLVRGIVEAHGGNVSIESSLATGTTFQVVLPLQNRPELS